MSKLLKEWLNNDIHLSIPLESFELDLSNGYYIGEIMNKVGLQNDFNTFKNSNTPAVMLSNYTKLLPSMRHLGIPFDSRLVSDLMTSKQGVATKLIYQIKMAVNHDHKKSNMDQTVELTKQFNETQGPKSPNSVTIHLENPGKNKYFAMQDKIFEQRLVETSKSIAGRDAKQNAAHLARFEEEMLRQELESFQKQATDNAINAERRAKQVQLDMERRRARRQYVEDRTNSDYEKWRTFQNLREETERQDLKFEMTINENRFAESTLKQSELKAEVSNCIDEFERNVAKLGISLDENSAQVNGNVSNKSATTLRNDELEQLRVTGPMDALKHLDYLATKLPDKSSQAKLSTEHMAKIQTKTLEDKEARKERERRRRKVLVDQAKAGQDAEQKRKEQALLEKFARMSALEREMAENVWRARQCKAIIKENRIYRDQQYKLRMEEDMVLAQERNKQAWLTEKEETDKRVAAARIRYQEKEKIHKDEVTRINTIYCGEVVQSILQLALKTASFRALGEELVPAPIWREWIASFVAGKNQYGDKTINMKASSIADADIEELSRDIVPTSYETQFFDSVQLDDYLNGFGYWSDSSNNPDNQAPSSHLLGAVVNGIFDASADPLPPLAPRIPQFPIGIAIIGKTKAGKSSLVENICQSYALFKIALEDLVKEAANSLENLDDSINSRIKKLLSDSLEITDEMYVELLVQKLKALKESPENNGGYVIVDFPHTAQQAALLEAAMSGFEIPKNDKKSKIDNSKKGKTKIANLPVPPPRTDPLPSGLDCIIHLEANGSDHDALMKRLLNIRLDPETGIEYDLDFNPPSEEDNIINRLIVPPRLIDAEAKMPAAFQTFDSDWPELKEWYSQYNILHNISAIKKIDEVSSLALEILNSCLQIKKDKAGSKEETDSVKSIFVPPSVSNLPSYVSIYNLFKSRSMQKNMAKIFNSRWNDLENGYITGVQNALRKWRNNRISQSQYLATLCKDFNTYIQRPSLEKSSLVDEFQSNFNKLDPDMRFDDEVKAELHQRVDDLSESLWNVVVKRKDLANSELQIQKEAKFVEWQLEWLVSLFMHLMQLEVDKFINIIKFVHEVLFLQGQFNVPAIPDVNSKLSIPYPVAFPSLSTDFKATEKYQAWLSEVSKFGIHEEKDIKKDTKDAKNVKAPAGKTANAAKDAPTEDNSTIIFSKLSESFDFISNISKSYGVYEPLKSDVTAIKAPAKEKKEEKEARELKEKAEQVAYDQEHEELINSPIIQYYKEIRDLMVNTLEVRLQRLKSKCESECLSIKHQCDKIWKNLDNIIGENIKLENTAIENLSTIIKKNIEQGSNLPFALKLEGTTVTIDNKIRLIPLPIYREVGEEISTAFTFQQITNLSSNFITENVFLAQNEFADMMMRLYSNSSQLFPPNLHDVTNKSFEKLSLIFTFLPNIESSPKLVDIKRFILSLLWPIIGVPSIHDLNLLKHSFLQVDLKNSFFISSEDFFSIKTPWWFEKSLPTAVQNVKHLLNEIFSVNGNINWIQLLSYFAVDDEFNTGLEKLFYLHSTNIEKGSKEINISSLPSVLFLIPENREFPISHIWISGYWKLILNLLGCNSTDINGRINYLDFCTLAESQLSELCSLHKRVNVISLFK